MGKQPGRRRQTVRARLKARAAAAGEVCAGCGQVVALVDAVFVAVGDDEWAYCRGCALAGDEWGILSLLWEGALACGVPKG